MKPAVPPTSLIYSRYDQRYAEAGQCIARHGLTFLLAGRLRVVEAGVSREFGAGSLLFSRKNVLARFTKLPAADGPFRAITVVFDPAVLRAAAPAHADASEQLPPGRAAVVALPTTPALRAFGESLQADAGQELPAALVQDVQQRALALLLAAHPALRAVLFEFAPPGKIDLEAFMRQHFRFNVGLRQMAYLTGRSLAAFKRDFARIFHTSPARWLHQQRLAEAHYLLHEEHQRPSEVYHAVGFESLAHFSHAFRQRFGCPPSGVSAAGRSLS